MAFALEFTKQLIRRKQDQMAPIDVAFWAHGWLVLVDSTFSLFHTSRLYL